MHMEEKDKEFLKEISRVINEMNSEESDDFSENADIDEYFFDIL